MKKILTVTACVLASLTLCACSVPAVTAESGGVPNELRQIQERISELESKLEQTQTQLEGTKTELADAKTELTKTQEQNAELTARLGAYDDGYGNYNAERTGYMSYEEWRELVNKQIENLYGGKIEFTETAPVVGRPENHEVVCRFDSLDDRFNDEPKNVTFASFLDYYKTELKPKIKSDFVLFQPLTDMTYNESPQRRIYTVYADRISNGIPIKPIIYESLRMYVPELKGQYDWLYRTFDYYGCGTISPTVGLNLYLLPVNFDTSFGIDEIIVKFGTYTKLWDDNETQEVQYFNIYYRADCIGTGYFSCYDPYFSKTWIEKYLTTHAMVV